MLDLSRFTTHRRGFLGRLAAGAAAFGLQGRRRAAGLGGEPAPGRADSAVGRDRRESHPGAGLRLLLRGVDRRQGARSAGAAADADSGAVASAAGAVCGTTL